MPGAGGTCEGTGHAKKLPQACHRFSLPGCGLRQPRRPRGAAQGSFLRLEVARTDGRVMSRALTEIRATWTALFGFFGCWGVGGGGGAITFHHQCICLVGGWGGVITFHHHSSALVGGGVVYPLELRGLQCEKLTQPSPRSEAFSFQLWAVPSRLLRRGAAGRRWSMLDLGWTHSSDALPLLSSNQIERRKESKKEEHKHLFYFEHPHLTWIGVGHSRETLGFGTPGRPGHSSESGVGHAAHSRETLRLGPSSRTLELGTIWSLWGWAPQGDSAIGASGLGTPGGLGAPGRL